MGVSVGNVLPADASYYLGGTLSGFFVKQLVRSLVTGDRSVFRVLTPGCDGYSGKRRTTLEIVILEPRLDETESSVLDCTRHLYRSASDTLGA